MAIFQVRSIPMVLGILIAFPLIPDNEIQNAPQEQPGDLYYQDQLVLDAIERGFWPVEQYKINSNAQNPFYLRANFDDDCKTDVAVLVTNRNSGQAAIVLVNSSQDTAWVVGDGQRDPETGLQITGSYMRIVPKGTNIRYHVPFKPDQLEYLALPCDGLEVGRGESFAVLYYWRDGFFDMLVIRD